MSYARFSDFSDVYVFAHVDGYVSCCGCLLSDNWEHHSAQDVVDHLIDHVEAGHRVPEALLDVTLYDEDDFLPY